MVKRQCIYAVTYMCRLKLKSIAIGGVQMIEIIISALLGLIFGAFVSYNYLKKVNDSKVTGAKQSSALILEEAKREAEALKKEALLEAKDETHQLRTEAESDIRERRMDLQKQENRLVAKRRES